MPRPSAGSAQTVVAPAGRLRPGRWVLCCLCLLMADGVVAATCTSQASGNWNVAGTWTGCGGTVPGNNDDVVVAAGHTVTVNVNTSNIGSVTIQATGILQGDGTGKILNFGKDGGTDFTNNGTINFTGANLATLRLSKSAQVTGGGAWNLSVLNLNNRILFFAAGTTATLNFSDAASPITGAGILSSLATITYNFTGTTAQTLPASANVRYGNVTVNNTAGVTLGVDLTATTILGNLTVQTGTLYNGGFAITLAAAKNFAVQGSSTFNLTGTSTMVTVSGGGTKSFNATAPCSTVNYAGANQTVTNEAYGNLTLGGSGTKTLPGTSMTVGCDFTMAGTASATAAQSLVVNGNFNISTAGATFSAATFSHQVQGNFSRTGTFNANTSTFTFNGTANQTVTGATTFNILTLDNAAGLTLASNVTVGNVMNFTSGKVTTGANKLIIGTTGSHTGSSSTRYVVGTMEKTGPVGTFTYPIGDAANYTPVNVAFTSGGATGSLAANTTAGEHPSVGSSTLDSTKSVNRYWTLTSTGLTGTYDATFNFITPGDVDSASDYTGYTIQRYSGGAWVTTTLGTQNSANTSTTGLTGFGDFAIAVPVVGINHYLVGHDGSMVTCLTEQVTFTAHNAGHNPVNPAAGNVLAITTSTGRGTWTSIGSGTGSLSDPTPGNADNGDASYTFPGGESSVTLNFRYTAPVADPEAINFNVSDSNAKTELSGTAGGDADDADLLASKTGFLFRNNTDNNTTIPTQIAGKRSNQGFASKVLSLRAVRTSDSDPTQCTGLFANGADVTVELGAECRNPATCAGRQVSVLNNGITTSVATNADNGGADTSSYTAVALRFGANSTATLHLRYVDAGQMQMHARYDLGNPAGTYMVGASNDFVVRPFAFLINVTGNPAAADENGAAFKAADDDFTVSVVAVAWQAADDTDVNGIPDGHDDADPGNNDSLATNTVLPNFGQESGMGEDIVLAAVLEQPAAGTDPGLAGGTSITSFSAGSGSTATARYGEVGIVELSAAVGDGDYLGAGAGDTGLALSRSGRVGRFHPFDFNITGNSPQFAATCDADSTDFTYLEQPFNYATAPQATITARSKLGTTTTNYDGAWWKLGDFGVSYAHDGGVLPGGTILDTAAATTTVDVDCSAGTCDGVFVANLDGPLTYTRTVTPVVPVNAGVDITFDSIADSDGAAYAGNPFKFDNVGFSGGFNQQRWGRLVVGQSVGDPDLALDVPVSTQYYNGTTFITNPDDDCTTFSLANDVDLTNEDSGTQDGDQPMTIGAGTTSVTSGDGAMVDGIDLMTFSAPGGDNTGIVDIRVKLNTPPPQGADLPWLFYDWNGEGGFEISTFGRASFGIFSRPQSVIYSREPW